MSVFTYFTFAVGLSKPLRAPVGTLASIHEHIAEVEQKLKLKREKYKDNPVRWEYFGRFKNADVDNKTLCAEVEKHNRWVRWLYDRMAHWQKNPVKGKKGEAITVKAAEEFWHALEFLTVPIERWDEEYYRARMEHAYEVMRGRKSEGEKFDAKILTPKQAGAVILLFSQWLDTHDIRLDVPNGLDELRASWDGGYSWSMTCGAIAEEDEDDHARKCRKKDCDVRHAVRDDRELDYIR